MPRSIFFIRHGKTIWNERGVYQGTLDSPLSEEGRAQAVRFADFLSDKNIRRLYSSPLGRAIETAEIISGKLKCEFTIIDEFHEMDFGIFQGTDEKTTNEKFSDFLKKREQDKLHTAFPGGESYHDVFLRVRDKALGVASEIGNTAIIGHESVNRIIRAVIVGNPLPEAVYNKQKNNEIIEWDFSGKREIAHLIWPGQSIPDSVKVEP